MAISLPLSKIVDSTEMVVAPGALIQSEGQALVRVASNQAAGVQPSTGNSSDKFVGFSFAGTSAAPFIESLSNKVETYVASSTGTITLERTPVSGQVSVFDNTANSAVSSPSVSGATISSLTAGHTYTVTYKFAMTVLEAVGLYGDVQPGGYSGSLYGQVGVITRGLVYTSEFDASKNWAAATGVKLAANGQLTDQTGSGVAIAAQIEAVPNEDYPFLGLRISAPAI